MEPSANDQHTSSAPETDQPLTIAAGQITQQSTIVDVTVESEQLTIAVEQVTQELTIVEVTPVTAAIPGATDTNQPDSVARQGTQVRTVVISRAQSEEEEDTHIPTISGSSRAHHAPTLQDRLTRSRIHPESSRENETDNYTYDNTPTKQGVIFAFKYTEVPLKKPLHLSTQIIDMILFVLNLFVSIADIVISPEGFALKVTILVLNAVASLVFAILWLVGEKKNFSSEEAKDNFKKKQQYTENILSVILILLVLSLSLIALVAEGASERSALFWIQIVLIILDFAILLYNQIQRLYMVIRIVKTLKKCRKASSWKDAGSILPRFVWLFIGNILILVILLVMLGFQKYTEVQTNTYSNIPDYSISLASSVLIVCIILLPILNIILFIAGNIYWVMEVLIEINYNFAKDKSLQETLKVKCPKVAQDLIHYAKENVNQYFLPSYSIGKKLVDPILSTKFTFLAYFTYILLLITMSLIHGNNVYIFIWTFVVVYVVTNPQFTFQLMLSNIMLMTLIAQLQIIICCACIFKQDMTSCCIPLFNCRWHLVA